MTTWILAVLVLYFCQIYLTALMAMGRVWIYAFWRGGPEGTADGQSVAVTTSSPPELAGGAVWLPLGVLTALVVYFGIQPEWMIELSTQGASGVVDPLGYLRSVLGEQG